MAARGDSRDDIWKQTGWFNDNGAWSFEASSSTPPFYTPPAMTKGRRYAPLSSVSRDPAFDAAYPSLVDIPVTVPRNALSGGAAAYYYPPSTASDIPIISMSGEDTRLEKSPYYLQHEKQHAVDNFEGRFKLWENETDQPWGHQRRELRAINGAYRDLYLTPEQRTARPPWDTEDEAFRAMHSQTYQSTPLNALARVSPY